MSLDLGDTKLMNESDTLDGSEIRQTHQLRLVIYHVIYKVLHIPVVFSPDFWSINSSESFWRIPHQVEVGLFNYGRWCSISSLNHIGLYCCPQILKGSHQKHMIIAKVIIYLHGGNSNNFSFSP